MRRLFFALTFLYLFVLGTHDVQAQGYDSGYYDQYWDGTEYQSYPQQYDPYYELHVLHYQLYLPQYQLYQAYPYCCVAGGIVVPGRPIGPLPPVVVKSRPPTIRRK
jgi:hypothetical protein